MKIAAIIAEYNPFHNGHLYLAQTAKEQLNADYVLAIMSGDFVQRGAPALCNKYLRTKMALSCGIDAVIELPALYALSSAEFFASGSIAILNELGCIDHLAFGSECGEITLLQKAASWLCNTSSEINRRISALLKDGLSYPVARAKVLSESGSATFSAPNDILGLEYCKALNHLKSNIQPFTIKRAGSGYHSDTLQEDATCFGSASGIRSVLTHEQQTLSVQQTSDTTTDFRLSAVAAHMPAPAYQLLKEGNITATYMIPDDFSSMLHYKLLSEQSHGFSRYLDCSQDLSDKICKHLPEFTTISDFCARLKSKDLTYTRISRVLFHILLNITYPKWYEDFQDTHTLFAPYVRLLGFRKEAQPLLSSINKNSSIPLISKLANASSYLNGEAYALLSHDIFCASVYETACFHKTGIAPLNEFRQSPIISFYDPCTCNR